MSNIVTLIAPYSGRFAYIATGGGTSWSGYQTNESGTTCIVDNFVLKEVTAYEIQNFTEAARLTNQPFGMQNFLLIQDSSGRPTGVATAGQIQGVDDERYLELPLATPVDKPILKDVDSIVGDDSLLLITYVDTTTEEVT